MIKTDFIVENENSQAWNDAERKNEIFTAIYKRVLEKRSESAWCDIRERLGENEDCSAFFATREEIEKEQTLEERAELKEIQKRFNERYRTVLRPAILADICAKSRQAFVVFRPVRIQARSRAYRTRTRRVTASHDDDGGGEDDGESDPPAQHYPHVTPHKKTQSNSTFVAVVTPWLLLRGLLPERGWAA